MKVWASSALSRHATLHAFKLLQAALCKSISDRASSLHRNSAASYSCRDDPFIYRPWILYLAGLTVFVHQYASSNSSSTLPQLADYNDHNLLHRSAGHYISTCAATDNAEHIPALISKEGCIALLHFLSQDFANAESEILIEAAKRLLEGIKMLLEPG
jgi:hypothetical protein